MTHPAGSTTRLRRGMSARPGKDRPLCPECLEEAVYTGCTLWCERCGGSWTSPSPQAPPSGAVNHTARAENVVYALFESNMQEDSAGKIHAVFAHSRDAEATLNAIKAEAAKHRTDPARPHWLEMGLIIDEWVVRPPGDTTLTFEEVRDY